jgi:GNAT superfamily N-acetyltransferase
MHELAPDRALAQAADENFVLHASWCLQALPAAVLERHPDLVVADSGLACDTFNLICRARLDEGTAGARAGWAISRFGTRPFSWWVGPGDRPQSLDAILEARGLIRSESELAMVADLSRLVESPAPAGFELRRVTTPEALAQFAELSAANWSPPDANVIRYYALAERALLRPDAPQWLFLGMADGAPVATAELTVSGALAGVYNISTRPSHRRRGIGTAMTLGPLLQARAAGSRQAVLQAAPDGVSIYRKLGFSPYGSFTEYKPPTSPGG